jgi:putative NADPH-quinone reductase
MSAAPRIVVVYAHPHHRRSRVNRYLSEVARKVRDVRVHDLYETYPDFHIDVEREQALLKKADLIVFQHPLIWYGMPSLLKEWVEAVFEAGWAHGTNGSALRGKDFWLVTSAGGNASSYQTGAYHGYPFDAFLPPFRQMAALCGMRWREPLVLFGADDAGQDEIEAHAEAYRLHLANYPAWL